MTPIDMHRVSQPDAPFRLDGEVALITGGGSGLGLGMARCTVQAGAKVVLVGRRADVLREAAQELGAAASFVVADINNDVANPALVDDAARCAGRAVSILINNAGVHLKKPAVATTESEFLSVLQTHVIAGFSLSRAVAPGMLERGRGSILFTASMTSFIGMPNVVAYSAAKSAYVGMIRALCAELSPSGVRVNGIAPGWITSDMLERALADDPARRQRILTRTPMSRFGAAEDIGWAAVYLCSPAAAFVTGTVLPVDGGACNGF